MVYQYQLLKGLQIPIKTFGSSQSGTISIVQAIPNYVSKGTKESEF